MNKDLFEHIFVTAGCGMKMPRPLSKEHTRLRALVQRAYDQGLLHGMVAQKELQREINTLQKDSIK